MKKFAALTISLLTALTATGGITASAVGGGTNYPEDKDFIKTLTFSSLTDYAVEGELYAFAEEKTVKVYDDGNYFEYPFKSDVINVGIFNEDGENVIYCACADEKSYVIPTQIESVRTFPESQDEITYNGYYYFIDEDGINVFDKSTKKTTTYGGEYSNIKQFGDNVYAMEDNALYSFNGAERSEIVLKYADYGATHQILIGQSRTSLQTYAEMQFVEIAEGSFMTAVNLDKLDGNYFEPIKTIRAKAEENTTTALLLCETGNAAIVAIGDTGYLVLQSKISEVEVDYNAENSYENAQMIGGMIYASPYIVSGTISYSNAIGSTVKVLNKIEYGSVLDSVFYEVEYTLNETTAKGYVAEGFLSPIKIADNKKPTEITDPEYSDSNDTKTILIIFAVVLLVLAAIAYISHVSSKGKKKGKKKKEKDSED